MKRLGGVLALGLLTLGGCGVLVIDVDVYKGSLVHDDDIQMGETVVMAIAARPLLVSLRDRLEWWRKAHWTDSDETTERQYLEAMSKHRALGWYRDSFISPRAYHFNHPLAIHINAILSLYEDRTVDSLAGLIRDLKSQTQRFQDARERLKPDRPREKDFLQSFGGAFHAGSDLASHPLVLDLVRAGVDAEKARGAVASVHEKMEGAYRQYLLEDAFISNDPDDATPRPLWVMRAHETLVNELEALGDPNRKEAVRGVLVKHGFGDAKPLPMPEAKDYHRNIANAQFRAFLEGDIVDTHTEFLLKPTTSAEEKKRFANHVKAVAGHFIESRDALKESVTTAFFLIDLLDPGTEFPGADPRGGRKESFKGLIDLVQTLVAVRYLMTGLTRQNPDTDPPMTALATELRNAAAKTGVPGLVGPTLADFARNVDTLKEKSAQAQAADADANKAEAEMKRVLKEGKPAADVEAARVKARQAQEKALEESRKDRDIRNKVYKALEGGLAEALKARPSETAHALLRIHADLSRAGGKDGDARLRFGLARGPTTTPSEIERVDGILRHSMDLLESALVDSGYERGRLSEGLFTLLEAYLKYQDESRHPEMHQEYKGRLLAALVRYATTVLFLANNIKFLDGVTSSLGDRSPDSYTRLLQAVGNSIMVEVDELRKKERHSEQLRARVDRTRAAFDYALTVEPERGLADAVEYFKDREKERAPGLEKLRASLDEAMAGKPAKEVEAIFAVWQSARADIAMAVCAARECEAAKPALLPELKTLGTRVSRRLIAERLRASLEKKAAAGAAAADAKAAEVRAMDAAFMRLVGLKETAVADLVAAAGKDQAADVVKQLNEAAKAVTNQTGEAALKVMREDLAKRGDTARRSPELSERTALEALGRLPLPLDAAFLLKPDTSLDILTDLVQTLEFEHTMVVHQLGADSPAAKRVEETLKLALSYRSGKLYLQPASAYLRSSTPASSLQGDARLVWENLLWQQLRRSIPGLWDVGEVETEDKRMAADIDKQFWQNINRVRVAGSGNVNYVVAKDDIGNWYVKGYSADPGVIFEGLKGVATYGIGAAGALKGVGKTLQQATTAPAAAEAPATPNAVTPPPTTQPIVKDARKERFEKAKKDFEARTEAENKDLEQAAGTFAADLSNKIAADARIKDFKDDAKAFEAWKTDVDTILKDTTLTPPERTVRALKRLRALLSAYTLEVYKREVKTDAAATRKAAREEAARHVEKVTTRFVGRRRESLTQYETELKMLAE